MSYEANVALLENLFLEADLTINPEPYMVHVYDIAIAGVAKYTPSTTIFEVLEGEELDPGDMYAPYFDRVVNLWFQPEPLITSSRNLLNYTPGSNWEDGYKHALATYLAAQGERVGLSESFYSWHDFDVEEKTTPVAVLSVYTLGWSEFAGTFCEPDDKVGIEGIAIFSDNKVRKLRLEGEFSHIIREITNS